MKMECSREVEVLETVTQGRWPAACDEEFRSHVRECAVCKDVAEVAVLIQEDYLSTMAEARVPSPSLLWWRAELRLKQDAARKATRPITLVEGLAAASSLGLIAALTGLLFPSIRGWFARFSSTGAALVPEVEVEAGTLLMGGIPISLAFVFGIACCLLLASVAAYWILSEE